MSHLDKLLEGVEVEWKTLREVIKLEKGKQLNKELLLDTGLYPAYNGGVSFSGFTNIYNYYENTIIISQGGASAGFVNFIPTRFYANAHCYVVLPNTKKVINRFIYHLLKLNQDRLMAKQHGAGIPALRTNEVLDIPIPIPCPDNPKKSLEIQQKIVGILDTFTQLTAELTAELTARKQQYSYYREALLSFDENEVEWKMLGEVGEIKRGVAFTKSQAVLGEFPVVANAAEPISFHNEFNRTGEFIVVARSGANAGLISYWNEDLFLTDAFSIHPNDSVLNTKFAFYFFKKHQIEIHLMKRGSGVPHVRASDFEIYKIPVPTLKEQERIVSILDKFDTLTTSISEGLPKELELRKKQYEYYRDILLTFPQKK